MFRLDLFRCNASAFLLLIVVFLAGPVAAESRLSYRGEVGSFTNDYFGDGHDRWRSGSYQRSYYSEGYQFTWADGLELRARAEIVTPWTPSKQPGSDILYSTSIGAAAFVHNRVLGFETRIGGEVLLLGDASGLEGLQATFHDSLGMDDSFDPSRDDLNRVENGVVLRFESEIGRAINFVPRTMVRPYVDATFGADEAMGLGVDFVIGPLAGAEVWTRDVVTGRLLTPETNRISGTSWVAGWDIRSVETSVHFPDHAEVELEPIQQRARVGVQVGSKFANFFIGQAWVSPSFVGQSESQRLGMLSVAFVF